MSSLLSPCQPPHHLNQGDLACMIPVRNERIRLPDVLRHHRNLGIARFLIVDNGSTDGTVDFLLNEPDVDLWLTSQPFSDASFGIKWFNQLAEIYGSNRWYLIIDADELLVYPEMATTRLPQFCEALRNRNIVGIRAPMIDMYPAGNIFECQYEPGDSLIDTYSFFDGMGYRYLKTNNGGLVLRGGPRSRIISSTEQPFYNVLEKYPLRFWHDQECFSSIHTHPAVSLKSIPLAALLHFKFLPDFKAKVDDALFTRQHWKDSMEYQEYGKNIEQLSHPYYEGSVRYRGPESLTQLKIMFSFNTINKTHSK